MDEQKDAVTFEEFPGWAHRAVRFVNCTWVARWIGKGRPVPDRLTRLMYYASSLVDEVDLMEEARERLKESRSGLESAKTTVDLVRGSAATLYFGAALSYELGNGTATAFVQATAARHVEEVPPDVASLRVLARVRTLFRDGGAVSEWPFALIDLMMMIINRAIQNLEGAGISVDEAISLSLNRLRGESGGTLAAEIFSDESVWPEERLVKHLRVANLPVANSAAAREARA